ncbi:MAG: molecular chaperone TorD family protein [Gammaproteobacteria bacterium]|nr:molecular chaperone TorD family protein [Gammaproteobacteria bacterium]
MSNPLDAFGSSVALDLMMLARLHDRELDASMVAALKSSGFSDGLAFRLESTKGIEALALTVAAIDSMTDEPEVLDGLAVDFAAIYLTHGLGASPCESVWLDEDGLVMQQPMFSVRESYARAGFGVPDWRLRPDDHLVFQLQFVANLLEQKHVAAFAEAARFLDDHSLRWLPDFADRVAQRAATPFYAGLAMLTAVYVDELRDVLARVLDQPRPTPEQVEARTRQVEEVALPMPNAYVPGSSPSW